MSILNYSLGISYIEDSQKEKWFLAKDVAKCLGISTHGLTQKRSVVSRKLYFSEVQRSCSFVNEESLLSLFQDPALAAQLKTGKLGLSAYEAVIKIGLICRAIGLGPNYKIKKARNWIPENTAAGGLGLVYDEVWAPYGIVEGVNLLPQELNIDLAKEIGNNFLQFQFVFIGDLLPLKEEIQKVVYGPELKPELSSWSRDYIRNCYENKGFPDKINKLIINQWRIAQRDTFLYDAFQKLPLQGPALRLANRSNGWPDLLGAPTAGF